MSSGSDFEILHAASERVVRFAQYDEAEGGADLRSVLKRSASSTATSHDSSFSYCKEPYHSVWSPQLTQSGFSPIPEAIMEDFGRVECASFMGLMPEIHRAWVSVDNRLYLWNYERQEAFTLYDGLSDVIFSVALAAPRPGIFTDAVKYVLVVATSVEVVLLAVTWRDSGNGMDDLRLQSTQYAISTDNSTIFKIACSSKGRIFLAGNDRNLYEMVYENDKDSWKTYLGLETPFKCRKVSHSGWSLVNLFDPVLRALGGAEDGLVDLTIDDTRNILYGVSASGKLSVFSLGTDGLALSRAAADFDVIAYVQDFFGARAPTSRNSPLLDASALRVASIHVVEPTEAKDVHIVVVMTSGVRVYVALTTPYGKPVVNGFDLQQAVIQIVGVRAPPTPKMLNDLSVDPDSSNNRVGAPNGSLQVNNAFYSHRVFVSAANNPLNSSDVLVAIAEDFVRRKTSSSIGMDDSGAMKEGFCVVECSPAPGRVHEIREVCLHIKDPVISALRISYSTAMCRADPSKDLVGTAAASAQVLDPVTSETQLPMGPPFGLPHAGWGLSDKRAGLTKSEIDNGAVASLGEMTLQQGPAEAYLQRKIMCLSNVGLHVLAKSRPVDYLFSILTRSNTSGTLPVDYLPEVGAFFDACGTLSAATMCIGLACGLPLDAGGDGVSLSDTIGASASGMALLQRRAISAVLRFTDGPTCVQSALLSSTRPQFGDSVAPVLTDSRVVAGDVSVVYSSCHDALYLFASRLLRSVWSKVIASDRSTNRKVSTKTPTVLMWKELLHTVIEPLTFFIKILKEYFGPTLAAAENALSGSASLAYVSSLESLNESKPGTLVSRQLARAAAAANGTTATSSAESGASRPEQLDVHARKEEDASILQLYRLMCRSLQALHLLSILLTLPEDYNISIPWECVKNLTFSSIVLSSPAQDAMKSMIQTVLNRLPSGGVEPILALVDSHCFMYFSAGDRLSLEASRMLDSASQLSSDTDTQQRNTLISSAINKLLQACVYWQSRASVDGESSALGRAISKLGALGGVLALDGIVDVGLRTADNFKRTSRDSKTSDRQSSGPNLTGDRRLYHGGSSPASSAAEMEHARRACYEALLLQMRILLVRVGNQLGAGVTKELLASALSNGADMNTSTVSNEGLAFRMASRAASLSSDILFHDMLYSELYNDCKAILIQLQSKFIEEYLLGKDEDLAYSFYSYNGLHMKAALFMDRRAFSTNASYSLESRLQDLSRAVSSAHRAVAAAHSDGSAAATEAELLSQLEDKLEVAGIQQLVRNALTAKLDSMHAAPESSMTPVQIQKREDLSILIDELSTSLVSVSELYNKATEPHKLWELSLLILHTCKHDDAELINKLWLSIIYRIVPSRSKNITVNKILDEKRRACFTLKSESQEYFEDDVNRWVKLLQGQIIDIGMRLQRDITAASQSSGSYIPAFNIPFLVGELEELACAIEVGTGGTASVTEEYTQRAWVARCLLKLGVGHFTLVDSYINVLQASNGKSEEKRIQLLSSVAFVLLEWTKIAVQHNASQNPDVRQLVAAARSGKIRAWLDAVSTGLNRIAASSLVQSQRLGSVLEDVRADVAETDQRLRSYLLA